MLRVVLLLAAIVPQFVTLDAPAPEDACAAEGALGCVDLAAEERVVRVAAEVPVVAEFQDASGRAIALREVHGDAMVPVPAGAARLVLREA